MKIVFVAGICILVLVSIFRVICKIEDKRIEKSRRKYFSEINLIEDNVSYEKYKVIAKRVTVRNSTVRTGGDFFDFIFSYMTNIDCNSIENQISKVNCGENEYGQ